MKIIFIIIVLLKIFNMSYASNIHCDTLSLRDKSEEAQKVIGTLYIELLLSEKHDINDEYFNKINSEEILSTICKTDSIIYEPQTLEDPPFIYIEHCIKYHHLITVITCYRAGSYNKTDSSNNFYEYDPYDYYQTIRIYKIGAKIINTDNQGNFLDDKFLYWIIFDK